MNKTGLSAVVFGATGAVGSVSLPLYFRPLFDYYSLLRIGAGFIV